MVNVKIEDKERKGESEVMSVESDKKGELIFLPEWKRK